MSAERFETLAVHGGEPRPAAGGSVVFPIYQGTVFEAGPDDSAAPYIRLGTNPTQRHLHRRLAALEGAEAAVATSSGMAAITTALHSVLGAGGHLIAAGAFYGGTHQFLAEHAERLGWAFDLVDPEDEESWRKALRPGTKAFLTESITNPLIQVGDLVGAARFAREHGLTSIIDNTFATPVVFRPHAVGFDLVCHSATKALNGHSDIAAGVVTGSSERIERVASVLSAFGCSLDPHAAFLLSRGLKTLALRVRQQNANALAVAEFLAAHEKIAHVRYPGLAAHPDHRRAAELFDGFGSVLSFQPVGGTAAAEALIRALRVPYAASSLGGVESLVTRLAAGGHTGAAAFGPAGLEDDLIRFSAGIEAAEDLVADFAQALGA
ncbi:trans-sulfuration enzyme family protein [Glycomyces harbinensis]|uniref:homocysteine desulfhydrase n=1 Tax=Glycomyces harbinensis TaxID=58114 RepID=A0A1G6XX98_9ACTN|nr:PLP-dependent transferase [Glycomyces harbinensis]SDD82854.1 cystathionine gamma-synthase/cystathionine gamma-lyase/cystathionine beta-lyase [Glycomyces harbinensis]